MSFWDDDSGYDLRDPKHPDWAGSLELKADMDRSRIALGGDCSAVTRAINEIMKGGAGRTQTDSPAAS